jgi:hypothetical protein
MAFDKDFRTKIKEYADKYWFTACEDGTVWTANQAINISAEIAKRPGCKTGKWSAAFLRYEEVGGVRAEGLYLIDAANLAKVKGTTHAENYPERKMLCSWDDVEKNNRVNLADKVAPYFGLNDCSHYVSQCLKAGGIHVETLSAPMLFNNLRARADTKTLALTVDKEKAKLIVHSGVLNVGDVFVFSLTPTDHHHAAIYLGFVNGEPRITMHTHSNHPDRTDPTFSRDWENSANSSHPLVTLIHFNDDPIQLLGAPLLGWWKVTWRQKIYFYFFDGDGRVSYTTQKPTNWGVKPAVDRNQKGYWFVNSSMKASICWPVSGSLETINIGSLNSSVPGSVSIKGRWNNMDDMEFDRLP